MEERESAPDRVTVWFCPLHEAAGRSTEPHNETCNTIEIGWLEVDPE